MITSLHQLVKQINLSDEEIYKKAIENIWRIRLSSSNDIFVIVDNSKNSNAYNEKIKICYLPSLKKVKLGDREMYLNDVIAVFVEKNILPTTFKKTKFKTIGGDVKSFKIEKNEEKALKIEELIEEIDKVVPLDASKKEEIKSKIENIIERYYQSTEGKKLSLRATIRLIIINTKKEKKELLEEYLKVENKEGICNICGRKSEEFITEITGVIDVLVKTNNVFTYMHDDKEVPSTLKICSSCGIKLLSYLDRITFYSKNLPTIAGIYKVKCFPYFLSEGEEKKEFSTITFLDQFCREDLQTILEDIIQQEEKSQQRNLEIYLDCYIFNLEQGGNKINIYSTLPHVELKRVINIWKAVEKFKKERKEIFEKFKKEVNLFSKGGLLESILIKRGKDVDPSSQELFFSLLKSIFLGKELSLNEKELLWKVFNKKIRQLVYSEEEKKIEKEARKLILFFEFLSVPELSKLTGVENLLKNKGNKIMEIESAKEFIVWLGKTLRSVDKEMKKEGKEPIGKSLLGKENLNVEDIVKIFGEVARRIVIYFENHDFLLFKDKDNIFKKIEEELKNLEKSNMLKFYLCYGYFMQ